MSQYINPVSSYDIVKFAESLGYSNSEACIHLDDIRPKYEVKTLRWDVEEFENPEDSDYAFTPECFDIMAKFMIHLGVDTITVVE